MKTALKAGLTTTQKEELEKDFNSCPLLREQLIKICEKKANAIRIDARGKEGYDSPNWAFKQADAVGYERALHEIMSLLV